MRITKSKFRQLVQEALLREGARFDKEEQQAIDLTRELAALYRTLQGSHRTEEVMEMEDAYTRTFQDIKSQSTIAEDASSRHLRPRWHCKSNCRSGTSFIEQGSGRV